MLSAAVLIISGFCSAAEVHVDPVNGAPDGDGSAARPWAELQQVIDRNRAKAGDTIVLHSGDYGELQIVSKNNATPITIAAVDGNEPRFTHVHVQMSSQWVLRGLHVAPDPDAAERPRNLINIVPYGRGSVSDITIEHCALKSADDTSKWSKDDWNRRAVSGINAGGTRITIRHNQLTNINFGISVTASHALVEHNTIENFSGDGLRGLGDHSTFQYNTVKNCYDVNKNHDDGFQSWSRGDDGKVGTGVVKGIKLIGNTFVNYTDPDQPHRGTLQGIGCFDGFFEDWVVANNVVVTDHWHGITLLGARNCVIVHNTVIDQNDRRPGPPWVMIGRHKDGRASTGCIVRNNLTTAVRIDRGQDVAADHNLIVDDPARYFVDAEGFDLRPRPGCPAIDAGGDAPGVEMDLAGTKRPQGAAADIGAYEYTAAGR
jgi:hypothetical protein